MQQLGLFDRFKPPRLADLVAAGEPFILVTGRNPHLVCVRDGRNDELVGHWTWRKEATQTLKQSGYVHHCNVWRQIPRADGWLKSEFWRKTKVPNV
jgi:hypothetical protein